MDPRLSSALDALRWIAALAVVFSHACNLTIDPTLPPAGPLAACLYAGAHLAHAAVIVFFVLSGYLVGGSAVAAFRAGRFDLRRYLAARTARIYPVLVAALVAGAACDGAGLRWCASGGAYAAGGGIMWYDVAERLTPAHAAWSLANLQTVLGEALGSNHPLWSLAYEWWYYLLCPAVLFALWPGTPTRTRLAAIACAIGLIALLPRARLAYGALWTIGLAASQAPRLRWGAWPGLAALAGTAWLVSADAPRLALHAFLGLRPPLVQFACDAALAGATALVILGIRPGPALIGAAWHKRLADFSYSLYAGHHPFLLLVVAALQVQGGFAFRGAADLTALALAALLTLAAYAYALGLAAISERHTAAVRNWLLRRFGAAAG
jgi:peptidoglycan/LPS O-acetylase OafA/YrhL